jgi:hypothetical protein
MNAVKPGTRVALRNMLEVRYRGFSSSTAEKLARFLLDLPTQPSATNGHLRATLTLTHREI